MATEELHINQELAQLQQYVRGILNLYGILGINGLLKFVFIANRLETEEKFYLSSELLASELINNATHETKEKQVIYVSPLVKDITSTLCTIKESNLPHHKSFAHDEIMLAGSLPYIQFKSKYYRDLVSTIKDICNQQEQQAKQIVQDIWLMLQDEVPIDSILERLLPQYQTNKTIYDRLKVFEMYAPRWRYKGYSLFEVQSF